MRRRESIRKMGAIGCLAVLSTTALAEKFYKNELLYLGDKGLKILKESGIEDNWEEFYVNNDWAKYNEAHFVRPRISDNREKKTIYAFGFICPFRDGKNHDRIFHKGIRGLAHCLMATIRYKPNAEIEADHFVIKKNITGFHPIGGHPIKDYYTISLWGRGCKY